MLLLSTKGVHGGIYVYVFYSYKGGTDSVIVICIVCKYFLN
jgi:hypothetical protein